LAQVIAAEDKAKAEHDAEMIKNRVLWLVKNSQGRTYKDPVLASQSMRDPLLVDFYSKKFRMRKNEISPLFHDKEDLIDDEKEAGMLSMSDRQKNVLAKIQKENAEFFLK